MSINNNTKHEEPCDRSVHPGQAQPDWEQPAQPDIHPKIHSVETRIGLPPIPPSPRKVLTNGPEHSPPPQISLHVPLDSLPHNSSRLLVSPAVSPRPSCSPRSPPVVPRLPKLPTLPAAEHTGVQTPPAKVDVATGVESVVVCDVEVQFRPTMADVATWMDQAQDSHLGESSMDVGVQISIAPLMVDAEIVVGCVTMQDASTIADAAVTCDTAVQLIQATADNETQTDTPTWLDSASQTVTKMSGDSLMGVFKQGSFADLQFVDGGLKVSLTSDAKQTLSMEPRKFHKHEEHTQSPDAIFADEAAARRTLSDVMHLLEACSGNLTVSYDQTFRPAEDEEHERHMSWLQDLAQNRTSLVEGVIRNMAKSDEAEVCESRISLKPGRRIFVDWQFLLTGDGVDEVLLTWNQEYGAALREGQKDDRPALEVEASDAGPPLPMRLPPAPPSYAAPRGRRRGSV